MSKGIPVAYIDARTRKITLGATATNIFLPSAVAPIVPWIVNDRGISTFVVQNDSASEWRCGYDNTITAKGGANPGIPIPAGGYIVRQVSAAILQRTGFWILGNVGEEGVVEELI